MMLHTKKQGMMKANFNNSEENSNQNHDYGDHNEDASNSNNESDNFITSMSDN